jgi:hypothetical protein
MAMCAKRCSRRPSGRGGTPRSTDPAVAAGRHGACAIAFAVGLLPMAATAADPSAGFGDAWRLSGFATLGLTHHGNRTAGVITSFSQREPAQDGVSARLDSVAGVQLDLRLREGTTATAQGVVRPGDDFRPQLRMAYLRQALSADAAVRVGRLRSPLYFDSDVAEIGFAQLTTRPAMPVYGVTANYVPHLDGADLQWRRNFGQAGVLVQAYGGQARGRQIFHNTNPLDEARFDLRGVFGVALSVGLPAVTLRIAHTVTDRFELRSPQLDALNGGIGTIAGGLAAVASDPRLPAPARAALQGQAAGIAALSQPFDSRPTYTSVGFDTNLAQWRVTGEWAAFDSRQTASGLVGQYRGATVTVGYSWGAFTPYVGIARNDRSGGNLDTQVLQPTGIDPALDGAIAQARAGLDAAARFADLSSRSATVGMRWDARDNLAVKLQFDRLTTPSSGVPGVLAVPALPFDNRVNLFSASLNFIF